jgi:hypothetical protein
VDALAGPALVDAEVGLVPGRADIVAHVVEDVVPAGRHRDQAEVLQTLLPALGLADVLGVGAEAPGGGRLLVERVGLSCG